MATKKTSKARPSRTAAAVKPPSKTRDIDLTAQSAADISLLASKTGLWLLSKRLEALLNSPRHDAIFVREYSASILLLQKAAFDAEDRKTGTGQGGDEGGRRTPVSGLIVAPDDDTIDRWLEKMARHAIAKPSGGN